MTRRDKRPHPALALEVKDFLEAYGGILTDDDEAAVRRTIDLIWAGAYAPYPKLYVER